MEAGGQSVVDLVDSLDSVLEGVDAHDAEDGREVLGQVELAARHHASTDTRGPQPIAQVPGLEHPVLALSQGGQASYGLLVVGDDNRADLRVQGCRQTHAQRGGRIHELASDTARAPRRSDEDQQGGRRALLSRVREGRMNDVAHRQIGVSGRGNDDGVLAARLAQQVHVGLPRTEETGRVVRARQDNAIDTLMRHQVARYVSVLERGEHDQLAGNPGLVESRDEFRGATLGRRGRLEDHRAARRQSSGDATHGNGHGEVPGRGNDSDVHGYESRARHVGLIGELQRGVRVVMAEVDRLAHLGIGLIDGLARLRSGDLYELPTARGENIADAMQRGCALLGGQGLPGVRRLDACLDEGVDRLVCIQGLCAGTHRFHTSRRGGDGRSNLAGPLPVGRQGGI
ncbi:Uncharacterised protein [Mycobacteroides abscessus subsp. abscessus]|nr:Uncharacterised protein [Mycobacteroides abscessus subsp. abscessus]